MAERSRTIKTAARRIPQAYHPLGETAALDRVLLGFSEFMDNFLRFLHSFFVEGRADQDLFLSKAQVCLDATLRQEQRKRQVCLDLFFEKRDCMAPGFIHR